MASKRKILVTGATGKQGRSVVNALRDSDFQLLALTRNTSTPAADSLRSEPHVQVVQANLDSEESLRRVFGDAGGHNSIWGVFMMLPYSGLGQSTEGEERQGKLLADISVEYGVSVFVYSSAQQGGGEFENSVEDVWIDQHGKYRIETHIRDLGETKGLRWTIIRPAIFMELFEGFMGKVSATVMRAGFKPETKLQLAAVDDIGGVAAAVFNNPETTSRQILPVVSDELTMQELNDTYKKVTGSNLCSLPNALGSLVLSMNKGAKAVIVHFEGLSDKHTERRDIVDAQIARTHDLYPQMTSFESWVGKQKGKTGESQGDWNKVSLWKLLTGRS